MRFEALCYLAPCAVGVQGCIVRRRTMKEFFFATIAALMVALSPTLGLAQQPGGYGSTAAPQAAPHAAIICTGHSAWGESRIELERLIPGATDGSAIYVR